MTHSRPPAFSREVAVKYLRQKIGNDSGNISGNISSHISRLLYANPNDLESRQHKARTTARPLSGQISGHTTTLDQFTWNPQSPYISIIFHAPTHTNRKLRQKRQEDRQTFRPHLRPHLGKKIGKPNPRRPRFRHSV
ncbi:MAG: hypothetical protein ACXWP0_18755 [Ktedonobacterales bacterium]